MKKLLSGIIVGLLAGGAGVWLFLRNHEADEHAGKKEDEKKETSRVQQGTNGQPFLKLDKETQERAGLKMVALESADLKPEIKAFGRVMDASTLATSLMDLASARSQFETSAKEAHRLKTLFDQNQNASARALETAEAAFKRDQIAVQAVELRLVTTWGQAIASKQNLDRFVHSLVTQESALVRVDLPASEKIDGAPTSARIALLSAPENIMEAEFIGPALTADPQTLGRGFLFLAQSKALAVNAALTAWMDFPGDTQKGVIVPRDAIVRHDGEAFVYVQSGDETFARKTIELEHPLEEGWFTGAFKPGTKIVITGAQQLLSEELKGAGGGE